MFLGTFTPKFLAKGQIALPAKIRNGLGGDRTVLTTGFDKCLYGFSLEDWQKIAASELVKPLSTAEGRLVRRQMFASAEEVDLDNQGRFVINENLRNYAGINGEEVIVIGAGDHFEIWDKNEWEKTRLVTLGNE